MPFAGRAMLLAYTGMMPEWQVVFRWKWPSYDGHACGASIFTKMKGLFGIHCVDHTLITGGNAQNIRGPRDIKGDPCCYYDLIILGNIAFG